MTRTLRQSPERKDLIVDSRPQTEAADAEEEVLFFDDQGQPFSFADLVPMSEEERRRLGFPFDVPDEFNEGEAQWIRQQRSRLTASKR